MRKSKLIKTIVKISTIIFILLMVVNLWLNGANAIIEKAMWLFGCITIFWILWPQLFKKRTNK